VNARVPTRAPAITASRPTPSPATVALTTAALAIGVVATAAGCSSPSSPPGRATTTLPDGRVVALDGGGLPPGTCAITRLSTERVIPTVVVIVDQSGSMVEPFGGRSRWNALRNALLDDTGLIRELEGSVRFGLTLYTGPDEDGSDLPACPHLTPVAPAMMNFAAIERMYAAADPGEETPTGDAIDAILGQILSIPDPEPGPTIFVVATDGEPDTCESPNPQEGQGEAIAAVERAYARGIRTYMVSVGSDVSEDHMQDMANAGLGRDGGDPDAAFWVAGDEGGLRTALREIIGGEVSCTLSLEGAIDPSMACDGSTVQMTGRTTPLECGTDWRALDETHIEILGDACTELLESRGATIDARFPCHTILI
jgi:hypothetical protein